MRQALPLVIAAALLSIPFLSSAQDTTSPVAEPPAAAAEQLTTGFSSLVLMAYEPGEGYPAYGSRFCEVMNGRSCSPDGSTALCDLYSPNEPVNQYGFCFCGGGTWSCLM